MEHKSKFREDEDHEQEGRLGQQQHHSAADSGLEFDSPEALLRHDAARTPVPPRIGERLGEALIREPARERAPWWKRLLGGGS